MNQVWIDIETYSTVPIGYGTEMYATGAEVMLFSYAFDDGPVQLWDLTATGRNMPADLRAALEDSSVQIVAHNYLFEKTLLRACGIAHLPVERWHCTMAQALQHGLPGGLDKLSAIFKLPSDVAKLDDGKRLINLFCVPRPRNMKVRRATSQTHPEEWKRFSEYCVHDTAAMRTIGKLLPRWNLQSVERQLFELDGDINERGVCIDVKFVKAATEAVHKAKGVLAARTADLTGGEVESTEQVAAFRQYLAETFDIVLPDMRAATVERALSGTAVPDIARELLLARTQASLTSGAKYKRMLQGVGVGDRIRGTMQFCGAARTGRWAGRHLQPQNLPRPTMKAADIEVGIEALKGGWDDLLTGDTMELASNALRGAIVSGPGMRLCVADLANIEGRVLAWLAGEQWKIEAFLAYDLADGPDLYKLAYSRSFGVPVEQVDKDQRFIGKVQELALGYQGAAGAFGSMAALYGVTLPEQEITRIVRAWRRTNSAIVKFWYAIDTAVRKVLTARMKNGKFAISEPIKVRGITIDTNMDWLRIRLPSGRYLSYPAAVINPLPDGRSVIEYRGVDPFTKQLSRLTTYGGKLCIAGGARVVTMRGPVPIEQVTAEDLVWDGVEWVTSQGAICNGTRDVIKAHGVWMTPDHPVLTTEGWIDASSSGRYRRAACWLPDGGSVRGVRWSEVHLADPLRLREREIPACNGVEETTEPRDRCFVRMSTPAYDQREEHSARHGKASGVRSMGLNARALSSSVASCVEELRRAWHHGVRALARVVRGVLGGHGLNVSTRSYVGPHGQSARVLSAELPLGGSGYAGAKPPGVVTNRPSGVVGTIGCAQKHTGVSVRKRVASPVFDLVNCGPRHRFVVLDENDRPLIVHNCENICQAVARDVLAWAMLRVEAAGYRIVLSVHDELITEAPDKDEYSAERLCALMTQGEAWTDGLPLAAAGYVTKRYRKE